MKKVPIGIIDYKKLIEEGCAYVDKTLLIQEIIDRGTELALIPRPRRFGKTLNMSMLKCFFEKQKKTILIFFLLIKFGKQPIVNIKVNILWSFLL